ncbi:MAG: transcriptional regulator [Chloroflexota bacterium]|nr:transcriptional regulator [Chloroflexota bacterium]
MASADDSPVLYYKRGCTSCEKARAWLSDHGITVRERELFKNPLTAAEVEDLIGSRPVTDVLSTRTSEYKARGLDKGLPGDAELLRQMEAEPRLLRRPLLLVQEHLLVGFDQARWAAAFGVRPK